MLLYSLNSLLSFSLINQYCDFCTHLLFCQ
ncbi:putative signal peptide protein [Puccinia sorghi]|uniref:Putative signal peptide protein n=1 Tax=Puccinia sorghi TaxID=27349 RepID=A0A0L6UB27_9BASI|nr:putative signal peptide protein [Puccinia sorghi]